MAAGDAGSSGLYVVTLADFDPVAAALNAGRGAQAVIVTESGQLVEGVVPVMVWSPGATVPAGVPVLRPGQWLQDAVDHARVLPRLAPDEVGDPNTDGRP